MRRFWRIFNAALSLGLIGGGLWAATHTQEILDWWRLTTYQPPTAIQRLADNTTMISKGRDLFFVSHPEINAKDTFNTNCTNHGEESVVLGCYRAQRIYLYDVTDERLQGVEEVTAAHEMLHAIYERLNEDTKKRVDEMLQRQIDSMNDARLKEMIALYNKQEPGQLLNEMHSILPTEYASLSAELETYYKQYFADRQKVVAYAQKYEQLFVDSKQRIADYDTRLASLEARINANNGDLERRQRELHQRSAQMSAWESSGNIDAYNAAVPGYNSDVQAFNALVNETRALINEYNQLVDTRNKEVGAQNDLYNSLDSRYQPVPTD